MRKKNLLPFFPPLSVTDNLCDVAQAEMERALLQGERQAELDQMEAETDIIGQLQQKLDELESAIQMEKDKVQDERELRRNKVVLLFSSTLSSSLLFFLE